MVQADRHSRSEGVASLDKTIDGDDDGIVSLLVMSDQLGAFRSGRGQRQNKQRPREEHKTRPLSRFRKPLPMSWLEVKEYFSVAGCQFTSIKMPPKSTFGWANPHASMVPNQQRYGQSTVTGGHYSEAEYAGRLVRNPQDHARPRFTRLLHRINSA